MEWEKAKTILIAVFLLLNAGLLTMNILMARRYVISPEEISAITTVLSNNGISLECDISSMRDRPLRFLTIAAHDWDYDYISSTFFPEDSEVLRTMEEGGVIYSSLQTEATVTVTNAFTAGEVSELIYYSPVAQETYEGYLKKLGEQFESFELTRKTTDNDGETYLYNEIVNGSIIFESSVRLFFSNDGSAAINITKFDFESYMEGVHDVYRADEALLTFAHHEKDTAQGNIVVEGVQLGYIGDADAQEKTRRASPYYRIFVAGRSEPVIIDAVMNTVSH